jgi:hypothetical protein
MPQTILTFGAHTIVGVVMDDAVGNLITPTYLFNCMSKL